MQRTPSMPSSASTARSPPSTTRALELRADIVFHSASKYLNGHNDVMVGVLVTNTLDARWQEVIEARNLTGGVLGAFEAWLLIRGLRTLFCASPAPRPTRWQSPATSSDTPW